MSDSSSSSSSHWTIEFFGPKLLATAETSNDRQKYSNPTKEVTSSTRVISAIDDDDDDTRINTTTTTTKSIVGLYFSASWCPPCQTFTPLLIDFYNVINDKNGSNEKQRQQETLEIVFVSSDREERSFTDYYTKMPWLVVIMARLRCSIYKLYIVITIIATLIITTIAAVMINVFIDNVLHADPSPCRHLIIEYKCCCLLLNKKTLG